MSDQYNLITKEFLKEEDIKNIDSLTEKCIKFQDIAFKLDLDYKFADAAAKNYISRGVKNEFFLMAKNTLVGYLGINKFYKKPMEITGMVHPDYRRQGIFTELFEAAMEEAKKRREKNVLLLCDPNSREGIRFIRRKGASYKFMEYEMVLKSDYEVEELYTRNFTLEKATNKDAYEIYQQNKTAEGLDNVSREFMATIGDYELPEEESKKGVDIYLIRFLNQVIGKINLSVVDGDGWIYGFFIYSAFRGEGNGKKALLKSIDLFRKNGVKDIYLQVDSRNKTAFGLYKAVGFRVKSVMEYFELEI